MKNIKDRRSYPQQQATVNISAVRPAPVVSRWWKWKQLKRMDIVCILLSSGAFLLWSLSLQHESVRKMNDLGMVSTFPPTIIIALVVMTVSFCLALRQPQIRVPILLLHLALLIFMLYGIANLVEEAPRFDIVYRHAGYTEYIMRTGSVNPDLDAYFNWPGFFVLSALVTQLAGYHDILAYAGWAPVFNNLLYALPLYMIFTSASTNRRLTWLALWFFYLTNWVGQDYFSPQGLDLFMYLVIIAILVSWFKLSVQAGTGEQRWPWIRHFPPYMQRILSWLSVPDTVNLNSSKKQRAALLLILLTIFLFVVYSHPLTPFIVLASVGALVIFRRCAPSWLPVLMAIINGLWLILMARTFLMGHSSMVVGTVGQVSGNITAGVVQRVIEGDAEHTFVAVMRVIMTGLIWLLAFLGCLRRIREGHHDTTWILLALVAFPLIAVQQYGGEMFLRIYLFTLPLMVFFAASLFYPMQHHAMHGTVTWKTVGIISANLILLGGFLFTRYGNERMDYMTYAEVNGVRYLYSIAPTNSLFLAGWDGTPWQFKDYEKYTCYSMADTVPDADFTYSATPVVQFIGEHKHSNAYVIFTRSQAAQAYSLAGLPPGSLSRLQAALLKSGKFKLIYSNVDVQILIFLGK